MKQNISTNKAVIIHYDIYKAQNHVHRDNCKGAHTHTHTHTHTEAHMYACTHTRTHAHMSILIIQTLIYTQLKQTTNRDLS